MKYCPDVHRIAPILLAALLLAGCGGDDAPNASEEYANDVCGELSTWVTDVQGTVTSLTDQGLSISRDDIQTAFDQTKESTDAMVNDLEQLGPPESEDGQAAKSELDGLASTLRQQLDVIEQAVNSGGGMRSDRRDGQRLRSPLPRTPSTRRTRISRASTRPARSVTRSRARTSATRSAIRSPTSAPANRTKSPSLGEVSRGSQG